ncbi:MFS family permease [Ewingella americana]
MTSSTSPTEITETPPPAPLPPSVRWQLWIVAFGFFMQALDTTIVNTALPSMAVSLGENPLHMHSVVVAYVLTVAVMLPASGWLADRIGVKWVFFSAIVLFTVGSLLCAQSSSLQELVMSRVVQGVGGAMMVPVGRLTVLKIVPRSEYMAAMTMVTLPGQVGPLLGPALGGFLVEYASWHWIFLINLPVGIAGCIATVMIIPNYQMQTRRFDISGFVMLAIGMATLTLALDGSRGLGLSGWQLALLVTVGLASLGIYWLHARGNLSALFSLRLFHTATFKIGLIGSFFGPHRQRHAALYDAGLLAARPRLHAFPRWSDDGADGARQHGDEARGGAAGEQTGVSPGAGHRHAAAGLDNLSLPADRHLRRVLDDPYRAVLPRNGELAALLVNEHADAERPAAAPCQQRQQPAVDDHAAVDERRGERRRYLPRPVRPPAGAGGQREHAHRVPLLLFMHDLGYRYSGMDFLPRAER